VKYIQQIEIKLKIIPINDHEKSIMLLLVLVQVIKFITVQIEKRIVIAKRSLFKRKFLPCQNK